MRKGLSVVAVAVLTFLAVIPCQGQTTFLSLRMTAPTGYGSMRIAVGGPPNEPTFTALSFDSLNGSDPQGGPWQGLHVSGAFLVEQLLYGGPPFLMTLDATGQAVFEVGPGTVGAGFDPIYGVSLSPTTWASKVARYPHPLLAAKSAGFGAMRRHAALGDIDLDGHLDLANSDGIHFGNGALGFTTVATDPDGAEAALVDLFGDSYPELVVFDSGSLGVKIYPGDGTGSFLNQVPHLLTVTSSDFGAIRFADLDNDGDRDILFSSGATTSTGLSEFLQFSPGLYLSAGTFTHSASLACTTGDFNGDGKMDFLAHDATTGFATERLFVYIGNFVVPNGAHSQRIDVTSALPSTDTRWMESGDFNGDGHLDVLWVGRFEIGVLLGNGAFGFTYVPWSATSPCCGGDPGMASLADLDGDGDLDVAWVSSGSTLFVGWNDGSGAPSSVESWPLAGTDANHVLIGDGDGDGDQDLFVGGFPATVFMAN